MELKFEQIKYMKGKKVKELTKQYKADKSLSELLFLQNYRLRQEKLLKEVFGQ